MMLSSIIFVVLNRNFGICSLILLSGHGAALIAGYNTMMKMKRKQLTREKLCFMQRVFACL